MTTKRDRNQLTGYLKPNPFHETGRVSLMTGGLQPTEEYDGRLRVKLLDDNAESQEIPCSSYAEAIDLVKEHQYDVTVAKIVDRDGDVVFTSADMEIEVWESIWKQEKRREAVSVEERACPYDSISCFPDDLCVQCEIDKMQNAVSRE